MFGLETFTFSNPRQLFVVQVVLQISLNHARLEKAWAGPGMHLGRLAQPTD